MCGIIGFTGSLPAKDILIDGLARLEYRGYDSAGIALLNDDDTLTIRKKAGRVDELRAMCSDREYTSTCGIGHTRWATHGGVTDINAHPHKCGKVAIIHNGIIENYYDIIREYGLADMLVSEKKSCKYHIGILCIVHNVRGSSGKDICSEKCKPYGGCIK